MPSKVRTKSSKLGAHKGEAGAVNIDFYTDMKMSV